MLSSSRKSNANATGTRRRRGRRRLLGGALSAVGAGVVAALCVTYWVMGRVLPAWITRDTVIGSVPHARSERLPGPAIARRLLVVMVDGLGFEHARALPELAALRSGGAFRELDADYPSFTAPNVTAMVTGLGPRESGVRLNGIGDGAPYTDDVLRAAWDSGVYVRVRSRDFPDFLRCARPPAQADARGGRLQVLADWAVDRAKPAVTENELAATEIDVIHFGAVDDAGHEEGAASHAYAAAAREAGLFVSNAASRLDASRDVLFVLSDHGQLARGGHGGDEPEARRAFFLAWGNRVRTGGELPPRPMRDVASTISVTLGVATPSSNLGAPMLDLFDFSEAESARAATEPFDAAARFGCAVDETPACVRVDVTAAALDRSQGADQALALLAELSLEREQRALGREQNRSALRVAVGATLSLALIALARRRRGYWPRARRGAAAPLAVVLPYVAVLWLIGYRPTMSAMSGTEVFFRHATAAALAAGLVAAVAARRFRWGASEAGYVVVAAVAAWLPLAAFVGSDPLAVPPNVPSALVFMLSPVVAAAALAACAISATALLRARRQPAAAAPAR